MKGDTSEPLVPSKGGRTPTPTLDKGEPSGDIVVLKEPAHRLQSVEEEASQAMEMGEYQKALYLRMQGVALAKLCLADPTAAAVQSLNVVANAHLQLSDTYYHMGFTEQVCWHAQKVMEQCEPIREATAASNVLVAAFLAMAKGMLQRGNIDCIHYLQKALSLNHDLHGEEDVSNIPVHEVFADYYIHLGDNNMSEKGNGFSISKPTGKNGSEKILGLDPMDVSRTDNYGKALEELQKAWELIDNAQSTTGDLNKPFELGSKHKWKAVIHTKLAQTLAKQGKYEAATENYGKAINAHNMTNFPNQQALAQLHYEFGIIYHKLKKYQDAMKVLNEAARYFEQQRDTGKSDPVGMDVMKQQAITLRASGDLEASMQIFEDLLSLEKQHYGTNNIMVSETLTRMGDICADLKKVEDSCNFYNRALKILRKKMGPSEENVKQLVRCIKQLRSEEFQSPTATKPVVEAF